MRKSHFIFYFLVFCLIAIYAVSINAKDMLLTTLKGEKIILKDDNTWVMADGKIPTFERDFTVPVSGGKIVMVSTDGTWGFVDKEIVYVEDLIKVDSIIGNGHSVNKDVMAANAEAQKLAIAQATSKMKVALAKVKIDPKLLPDCIKQVEKEVDKKEDFKQGVGWDVTIKIILDRGSILAVADCAMKKEEDKKTNK
jgi:hypothetical protein